MVFLFLSVLFLILRSYSFLSPGAVVLSLSVLFFRKKGTALPGENRALPISILTLIFLAIGGLDGSTAGDLLDLICIHCSGILLLKGEWRQKSPSEETIYGFGKRFLADGQLFKETVLLLFFLIAGFRIWYQWNSNFWEEIGFLYLLKSSILTCILGFLYLRSGESGLKTLFFLFLVLCTLFVHPSQGILNFSYFYLFSFLQTDVESKKINVGTEYESKGSTSFSKD
ncbi:hypothetical protein [Leptospira barantonii]|uniref:Uncharacterized protein n=1 Tax=Leptospira barantonii TaxID=2023184 RepID=A0ABX4NIL0_9LEPT|nr:hypothetical protein [Leptospira barantonii]PJZ56610.1 hypothetical protein CH367_14240 [Leptospira barantonii]